MGKDEEQKKGLGHAPRPDSVFLRSRAYFWRRRRLAAPKPMRPRPKSAIVAGSGTDRCSSPDVTPLLVLTTLTPIVNE